MASPLPLFLSLSKYHEILLKTLTKSLQHFQFFLLFSLNWLVFLFWVYVIVDIAWERERGRSVRFGSVQGYLISNNENGGGGASNSRWRRADKKGVNRCISRCYCWWHFTYCYISSWCHQDQIPGPFIIIIIINCWIMWVRNLIVLLWWVFVFLNETMRFLYFLVWGFHCLDKLVCKVLFVW